MRNTVKDARREPRRDPNPVSSMAHRSQMELLPGVWVQVSPMRLLKRSIDRYRFMLLVLVKDLELPVERDDLLLPPEDTVSVAVPAANRLNMYRFIVHNQGLPTHALYAWVDQGRRPLSEIRVMLMREKIAAAGMGLDDFSKACQPMVPLPNARWRGDLQTVTALMREIAIFRAEAQQRQRAMEGMSPAEVQERQARLASLRMELQEVGLTVENLPWSGLEPTRVTFNRLLEHGDEKCDLDYDGLSPKSSMERWRCGLRRLALEQALEQAGLNKAQLMLDERIFNKMVVFIELGVIEGGTAGLVRDIVSALENGQTQWTRAKKRAKRWAFNFPLLDDDGEEEGVSEGPPARRSK